MPHMDTLPLPVPAERLPCIHPFIVTTSTWADSTTPLNASPSTKVKTMISPGQQPGSSIPYAFAFAFAELLALPGFAIALYLYVVGQVAGSRGWFAGLVQLFFSGVVILPFVLLCCSLLLIAGLFTAVRPWAAVALLVLNVMAAGMSWRLSPPAEIGELLAWLPTLASTAIAGWLVWHSFFKTAPA